MDITIEHQERGYRIDVLAQGYPGQSVEHGGLGWSSITLLRGRGRVVLVDTGSFSVRPALRRRLDACGVEPDEVTDVLLTHCHYDHSVNYVLFPAAAVWISAAELAWASCLAPDFSPVPELYVRELAQDPRIRPVDAGEETAPGIVAISAPGHTPGCLLYHLAGDGQDVLFTGDAAKNRAELLSRNAETSLDQELSRATLERIWELWRRKPDCLVIPGHDLPMVLDPVGEPMAADDRRAGVRAWLGKSLDDTSQFDLSEVR
jgi:N-acyl homoserine lactone hydrolase